MTLTPRELQLVMEEREECAKVAEGDTSFMMLQDFGLQQTCTQVRTNIAAAIRSRPAPASHATTPDEVGELIGRLDHSVTASDGIDISAETIRQAAASLRSLQAENERLREALEEARGILAREGWTDKGLAFIDSALASAKGTTE